MKKLSFLLMAMAILSVGLSSCKPGNDPTPSPTDIEGLWVQMCDSNAQTVPHMEIHGTRLVWCDAQVVTGDYSARSAALVSYNEKTNQGEVTQNNKQLFSFSLAQGGLLTSDERFFYRIENTLDSLNTQAGEPLLTSHPDMVGPSGDLGLDLNINLFEEEGQLQFAIDYAGLLIWAGKTIATSAVGAIGGKGTNYIMSQMFGDPTMQKMDEILGQTTAINNKMAQIISMIQMDHYEDYVNERLKFVSDMVRYNSTYLRMIEEVDTLVNPHKVDTIVMKWATEGQISGNKPTKQFLSFADWVTGSTIWNDNLYKTYDIYVFNATPWEKEGYAFREALRASDLAVITTSAQLAILYAQVCPDYSETVRKQEIEDIQSTVDNYIAFSNANPVERHSEVICQIENAHFVMSNTLTERNFNTCYWVPTGTRWNDDCVERLVYGSSSKSTQAFRSAQMTMDEAVAIYNYYQSSADTLSWLKVLAKGGLSSYARYENMSADNVFIQMNSYAGSMYIKPGYFYLMSYALPANWFMVGLVCNPAIVHVRAGGVGQYQEFSNIANDDYQRNQCWLSTNITKRY